MRARIEKIIAELNADAEARWEDEKQLVLLDCRDVAAEKIQLDILVGKWERALYTIVVGLHDYGIVHRESATPASDDALDTFVVGCLIPEMRAITIRRRIGAELRALRTKKGLTTRDLAVITGISQSHIVRIEAGKYGARIDTIETLARAIDAKLTISLKEKKLHS